MIARGSRANKPLDRALVEQAGDSTRLPRLKFIVCVDFEQADTVTEFIVLGKPDLRISPYKSRPSRYALGNDLASSELSASP